MRCRTYTMAVQRYAKSPADLLEVKLSGSRTLSALCLALTLGFGSATAMASEFCEIPKTSDGFVALRDKPSAGAALRARMRVGDEVMIDNSIAARNGWSPVYWWKGGRFQGQKVKGLDKSDGKGWVNTKLLGDECG